MSKNYESNHFPPWKLSFSDVENIVFRPRKRTSAYTSPQIIKELRFFFVQLFGSLDKRDYLCEPKQQQMNYEGFWHRLTTIYDAEEAKAIARLVLDVRFGLSWTDIICEKTDGLSTDEQEELERMVQRLETGEPVQYVLGEAEFGDRKTRRANSQARDLRVVPMGCYIKQTRCKYSRHRHR